MTLTPLRRSIAVAVLHVLLLSGLVVRYAWDRENAPHRWFRATPYDPNLPVRGRYLALRLEGLPDDNQPRGPVAFFIPEDAKDPSRLPPGDELWVDATLPPHAPPRPIRLGIRHPAGPIVPLEFR
jgi:hypothetical protein